MKKRVLWKFIIVWIQTDLRRIYDILK